MANTKRKRYCRVVDPNRKQAVIAIVAAILAARKVINGFHRTVLLTSLQSLTLSLMPGESLIGWRNRLLRMTGADRRFAESDCGRA
jgi:hypothetical protein